MQMCICRDNLNTCPQKQKKTKLKNRKKAEKESLDNF